MAEPSPSDTPEPDPDDPAGYPVEWETHAVLSDGAPVEIRPIKPSDAPELDAFHQRQSPTSIYYRYFQHRGRLRPEELTRLTTVDYRKRMAFVALLGDRLVAVARYEPYPVGERPEVAFLVDDDHQGRGLGTLMLEYLAAAARARGIPGFLASVLPENHRMLRVFRRAGFGTKTRFADGYIEVELDIAITSASTDAIAARASVARTRSVERLLRPTSIAVVGASRQPGAIGHELFANLRAGGFAGGLYPVNRAADELLGETAYDSIGAIGRPVDLAVVAVPAAEVEAVVADAAAAGVGALLVVSSGFSELGPKGAERERRLVDEARSNGMRLVGPNAFGLVNTAAEVSMRALFLPLHPEAGRVAVASQSGPLGSAVLERLRREGVGLSSFVAFGNRADVSVNDLLDYWTHDAETDVIIMYVENFGNLRNFAQRARAASIVKPVVTMRPSQGHVGELLDQSGVVVVEAVSELAEVAQLATDQPLPTGTNVAIVANAASVARLAVAACRRHGLNPVIPASIEIPEGPPEVDGAVLVADIDAISLAGGASPRDYEELVVTAAVSDDVDAVIIALVPNPGLDDDEVRTVVSRVDRSIEKPVVSVGLVGPEAIAVPGVPTYSFPDEAARTLGRLARYVVWRDEVRLGPAVYPEGPPVSTLPAVADHLGDADEVVMTLWTEGASELVELLGLPVPEWRAADEVEELVAAAESLGYPVVLKAQEARRRAIGEAGGVAIDLHDADQLRRAHARMTSDPDVDLRPAAVQRMVPSVANVRLELVQDPRQGSYVTVGLGGAAAASLPPVARRWAPLDGVLADQLVDALAGRVDLDPDARSAVRHVLLTLGELALAVPELATVTLDPFLVAGKASAAGDLEVVLRPWTPNPLNEVRRL
ncbi:MAG: GNAT family N-acetyltransferase [Actinomycetota bacterium]